MKKIITLLMAVALVATVSAQVQFDGRSIKNKRILSNEKVNSKAKSGFSKNRVHTKALGELITEQPEGEAKQYVRSGFGFVVYDNTLFTTEQEGKTTIVYDEDGTTVYIKNIVNGMYDSFGESWAVGTLSADGTTITVSLEQTVGWSYQYETGIRRGNFDG